MPASRQSVFSPPVSGRTATPEEKQETIRDTIRVATDQVKPAGQERSDPLDLLDLFQGNLEDIIPQGRQPTTGDAFNGETNTPVGTLLDRVDGIENPLIEAANSVIALVTRLGAYLSLLQENIDDLTSRIESEGSDEI